MTEKQEPSQLAWRLRDVMSNQRLASNLSALHGQLTGTAVTDEDEISIHRLLVQTNRTPKQSHNFPAALLACHRPPLLESPTRGCSEPDVSNQEVFSLGMDSRQRVHDILQAALDLVD